MSSATQEIKDQLEAVRTFKGKDQDDEDQDDKYKITTKKIEKIFFISDYLDRIVERVTDKVSVDEIDKGEITQMYRFLIRACKFVIEELPIANN